MRGGVSHDSRLRRRPSHRKHEEDGRDHEAARSRVTGQASFGRGGAVDWAVWNYGAGAQPENASADGSVQRDFRRDGSAWPLLPRAGTLYDRALELVLYESSAVH